MKKILAIMLALTMVLALAVPAFAADYDPLAPIEVPVVNYDFEDGTIMGWSHHWGSSNNTNDNGVLVTDRTGSNVMYATGVAVADTLVAGTTYYISGEVGYNDPDHAATTNISFALKAGGFDGEKYVEKVVSASQNEMTEFNLTFTPAEDITDAWISFNYEATGWGNGNPVDIRIDNVKIYYEIPVYEITVTDGTASTIGAKAGDVVTVTSNPPAQGMEFDKWVVSGITLADPTLPQVSFEMPANDVTLTAKYKETVLNPYFACAVLMMDDSTSKIYVEAGDIKYKKSMVMQVVDAQGNVLTQSTRNQADGRAYEYPFIGCSIFIKGECTDGWLQTTWTPDANAVPAKVLLVLDGVVRAEIPVNLGYDADYEEWTDVPGIGEELVGNAPSGIKGLSGFVVISSEYHAQIGIGKNLIIVNAHDFNLNGDCVYCGYHTDVEEDVVEIIDPTEPSTEEEEDETVEVTPDEEPEEDENPKTGLALALVPMMIAAAVAVITKK